MRGNRASPSLSAGAAARDRLVLSVWALLGCRFRSPDVSGIAEDGSSADWLIPTLGCVAASVPTTGGVVPRLCTTLPAEEKMPPLISRVEVSKNAMSSMFGATTDSAIW